MINRQKFARLVALSSATIGATAMAAVPAGVTTAMTEVATDVGLLGLALVGIAVVGIGFAVGIKYLKKAPRAA